GGGRGRRRALAGAEHLPHIGADGQVVADLLVVEVGGGEVRPVLVVGPEAVGIGAVDRQQRGRHLGAAPTGGGPDRQLQPCLFGEGAQRGQVLGLVVELVLHLGADHGAAVGVGEAGQLGGDLLVEGADQVQVGGVV